MADEFSRTQALVKRMHTAMDMVAKSKQTPVTNQIQECSLRTALFVVKKLLDENRPPTDEEIQAHLDSRTGREKENWEVMLAAEGL